MRDQLGASASGNQYDARDRPVSVAARCHWESGDRVWTVHAVRRARSGSPRVNADLLGRGRCRVTGVAKAVKSLKIRASSPPHVPRRHDGPVHAFLAADNVSGRDFTATKPNLVWLAARSISRQGEGVRERSGVEALLSRRVVGGTIAASMARR